MIKNAKEFIHEKYITKNEIDVTTLTAELQEKIKNFTKLKEQLAGLAKTFQGTKRAEMEVLSQELLDELEDYIEEEEEKEKKPAEQTAEEKEKAKKATENKSSSAWGWGIFAFLIGVAAVFFGTQPNAGTGKK